MISEMPENNNLITETIVPPVFFTRTVLHPPSLHVKRGGYHFNAGAV